MASSPGSEVDVFLIHGAGGASWEWDTWIAAYAIGYRIKYLHLRPIDLLPSSDGGLENTFFDDYVDQVIKKIDCNRDFILVGASMGGIIALKVAEVLNPIALVLVSSSLPGDLFGDRKSASPFPPIIRWATTANTTAVVIEDQQLSDTIKALPDSTRDMHIFACKRWRDELHGPGWGGWETVTYVTVPPTPSRMSQPRPFKRPCNPKWAGAPPG